jgi:hypothetical protein
MPQISTTTFRTGFGAITADDLNAIYDTVRLVDALQSEVENLKRLVAEQEAYPLRLVLVLGYQELDDNRFEFAWVESEYDADNPGRVIRVEGGETSYGGDYDPNNTDQNQPFEFSAYQQRS